MVRIGQDRFIVSSTELVVPMVSFNGSIINGTDRTPGAGFAHILVYDGDGKRIARATYNNPGDIEFHLGGVDYDVQNIWGTLAQYRPNSTASVIKIDPSTLQPTEVLRYRDHLGGIVHDTSTNDIYTLNWGARNASKFSLGRRGSHSKSPGSRPGFTKAQKVTRNPS